MGSAERRPVERPPAFTGGWSQERRLEFIEFRLLWEGKFNRGELVDFFGISIQQASLDLARYMEVAPGNLEYDRSEKVYKARPRFKPVFDRPDSQAFLAQLVGLAEGRTPNPLSYIGWRPPYAVVTPPTRSIRPEILMRVIWAIRDDEDLELTYQSMRRPLATRRWISPHAIAFDGTRWHVRAFCHANRYFKDFVFARIQQIHESRKSSIDPRSDFRWHSLATVALRARSGLTAGQRAAVEVEFGMRDGTLDVTIREALVFYFLRQLRLDSDPSSFGAGQMVEVANAEHLKPLLLEAARQ
jgi:hypothetical protein